jgi:hypothetical protein
MITHPGSPVDGDSSPTAIQSIRKELPAGTGDIFPMDESKSID